MLLFDTHEYVKKLKAVGFTEEQAEVQANAISNLANNELVTKEYLDLRLKVIEDKMATKTELADLLKWIIGLFVAQTGIVIAAFFAIARLIK